MDLQLSGWGPRLGELHVRLKSNLRPDMTVLKVSKSAAIRLRVPPLHLGEPFADQMAAVEAALAAAVELLNWAQTLPDLSP